MKHKLKTNQEYLDAIRRGDKTFEIRRDDRGFEEGHILWLKGWNPQAETYTGDELKVDVSYILRDAPQFGLAEGFCLMGIKIRPKPEVQVVEEYVEDITCLDAYPGLQIDAMRWSGDHVLPGRYLTFSWSAECGFGELCIGLDKNGTAHCDTEMMSGDFVRAVLTLFFLEANPEWDPRREDNKRPDNKLEAARLGYKD